MKSKELIKLLQEEDPTGEVEVCVGNSDIYFLSLEPAWYDGNLQVLIRDESKKPYYGISGVKYVSSGSKIQVHTMSVRDVLLNDPEAFIDYSGCGSADRIKRAKEYDDRIRQSHRNMFVQNDKDSFFDWAKKKALAMYPDNDLEDLRESTDYFYDQNFTPNDPLKELPVKVDDKGYSWHPSINDRRFAGWDDTVEVTFNGYWGVSKK